MRFVIAGLLVAATLVPPVTAQQDQPRVFLGIRGGSPGAGQPGAAVGEIVPGGTAEAIGLRPGDLIVEANGRKIASSGDMQAWTQSLRPGDRIELNIVRGSEKLTLAGTAQIGAPLPNAASDAITPSIARSTALDFARVLEQDYFDPAIGARYAAKLRERAAAGAFDSAGGKRALAEALTEEVLAVSPDKHLRLFAGSAPQGPRMMRTAPGARAEALAVIAPGQPLEEARVIAPGILYLRFSMFPNDPGVIAAVSAFLDGHQGAKSVIFDIRGHRGGSTGIMDAIFPYLYAKETALIWADARESVARQFGGEAPPTMRRLSAPAGIVRDEHVAIPHPTRDGLKDAQVFVLTSNATGSAAEHFALALKASGRATLIGATTRGMGHFALGGTRPIANGFSAFVPSGRTYDPRTGKGWEGTGVEPNVAVDPQLALIEALVRSGVERAKAETLGRN
jgi:C-terminal processing protease CtpA/Prc